MDNIKRYQICHRLITYFATLIFPKKSYLCLIFRNGGSINDMMSSLALAQTYEIESLA